MTQRSVSGAQKPPRLWLRVAATVFVCVVGFGSAKLYNVVSGPLEGALAPAQFGQQGEAVNVVSRGLAQTDIQGTLTTISILALGLIWGQYARRVMSVRADAAAALLLVTLVSGCSPYKVEQFVEIEDHETAFLVPMEGGKDQQEALNSREFLEKNFLSFKRVSLPLRSKKIGRMPWDIEWIPTARVVKTSRTPVHREWADSLSLTAQSSEGTKFRVDSVIAAGVLEEHAALFRSNYKDVPLAQIIDTNVRGFAQGKVAELFGNLPLEQCQRKKVEIFDAAEAAVKAEFEKFGVTVMYFGNRGGLSYVNRKVQDSIDQKFLEAVKQQIETKKLVAQQIRNQTTRETAEAQAKAATVLQTAADALEFTTDLEIAKMQAQARLDMAKKLSGTLPEMVLPEGNTGNLLLHVK
jgi:hypothetical protein